MSAPAEARAAGPFWRVFPWDPAAADGAPFSPRYVPSAAAQTGGRFDPGHVPVLYLAETPEHALAELLRRFTGKPLTRAHLHVADPRAPGTYHPRALVRVWLPEAIARELPDLGDGATLQRLGIRADALASAERGVTQAISRDLHARGVPGFRWWSALHGDWHATVLFLDRVSVAELRYDPPEPLSLQHLVVREVARQLGMTIGRRPALHLA